MSGVDDFLLVGSDDTSWVEWVRSGFERVGLSLGSVKRSELVLSGIGSWDPELSDNHSTDSEGTSLVGTDVLDTSKGLDGVHSSNEGISVSEVLGSSSKCQRDDSNERGGQDRDGSGNSVGSDSQGNIRWETGGSDNNDGNDDGTAEQKVGELVESGSGERLFLVSGETKPKVDCKTHFI